MSNKQLSYVAKWEESYKRFYHVLSVHFTDMWWGCFREFILIRKQIICVPLAKLCKQLITYRSSKSETSAGAEIIRSSDFRTEACNYSPDGNACKT